MPRYFNGSTDYVVFNIGACASATGPMTWAFALQKEVDKTSGLAYLAGVAPAYAAAVGYAGGTTINDNFTGGAGLTYTYIEGSTPEFAGDEVLMGPGHATTARVSARASNVLPSADHEAAINFSAYDGAFLASEEYGGVWVRLDASAVTGYTAVVHVESGWTTANIELLKCVAGSYTSLVYDTGHGDSAFWTHDFANDSHQIKLRATDESGSVRLRVYLDSVEVFNYLDSSSPITGNVRVGWVGRGTSGSAITLDSFVASTLSGGSTTNYVENGSGSRSVGTASTRLPIAEWGILVYRKAAGTTVARHSMYKFSNNTWTHEDGTGNVADGATVASNVVLGASAVSDNAFQGHLDIAGYWKSTLTDLQAESLTSLAAWTSLNPVGRWRFDQLDVNTQVPDLTGNGANEVGHNGTSVSALASPFVLATNGSSVPPHPARRRLPLLAR